MIGRKFFQTITLYILAGATLVPLVLPEGSRTAGYIFGIGMLLAATPVFLVGTRRADLRRLYASVWFLPIISLALLLIETLRFMSGSGQASILGLLQTYGYVVVLHLCLVVFPTGFLERWKTVMQLLALIGGLLSVGALAVGMGIPIYSGRIGQPIPVIGLNYNSSLLAGPNYFAVVAFLGAASAFFLRNRGFWWYIILGFNLMGILLAYSRAAYLACAVFFVSWLYYGRGRLTKLQYALLVGASLTIFTAFTDVTAFLQLERGLTGREILWPVAVQALRARPLTGWGQDGIEYLLRDVFDLRWASFHNTILDFAVAYGLIAGSFYTLGLAILIGRTMGLRGPSREMWAPLTVSFIPLMLFTTLTLGGINYGSLFMTLILGAANAERRLEQGGNHARPLGHA